MNKKIDLILGILMLVILIACQPNVEARTRRTPTPERGDRTPESTRLERPTSTVAVDETETPTAEITPTSPVTATATVTSTATVTPTPESTEEHDVTAWHEPMLFHHHGENPANFHPELLAAVEEYWTQEIASAWVSSAHENEFPSGDHAGFKNVSETSTGCPQGRAGSDAPCINAYVIQFHAMGTMQHARKPIHSIKAALLVCEDETFDSCGYVLTGGHNDYLFLHAPYKNYFCDQPNDPEIAEQYLDQLPYTAMPVKKQFEGTQHEQNAVFWNGQGPNPVIQSEVLENRGYLPNRMLSVAWFEVDAWDQAVGFSPLCLDNTEFTDLCEGDVNDDTCRWNGTEFQVFAIQLDNLPDERPFQGWTDRHGNLVDGCTEEGVDCVPLIISEGVPLEEPVFNRPVAPQNAPILNYDSDVLLRKPPFTLDD